jgi:hypothetical protein
MKRSAWIGLTVFMLFFCASRLAAQDSKKEPQLRSVRGIVTDKSEKLIADSVVFLKNVRTNVVLSHFTDAEGSYHFSGLDPNVDYEIHAEAGDLKSVTRTVSSLDNRKEMIVNLKLDRKRD